MIDLRSMNKKALTLITTLMIATQSLPAAFAESKMEYVTSGNKIVEQIGNAGDEQNIVDKKIETVEEFIEFRDNWYKEHKKIADAYSYDYEWMDEGLRSLVFVVNAGECFDIATKLSEMGIIFGSYDNVELLYTSIGNSTDFLLHLINEAMSDENFDLSSLCYGDKNKKIFKEIFDPIVTIFREKTINIDALEKYCNMIFELNDKLKDNPNLAVYTVQARAIVEILLEEKVIPAYPVKELQEVYEIKNPSSKNDIISAVNGMKIKKDVDKSSDNPVVKLMLISQKCRNTALEDMAKIISVFDDEIKAWTIE